MKPLADGVRNGIKSVTNIQKIKKILGLYKVIYENICNQLNMYAHYFECRNQIAKKGGEKFEQVCHTIIHYGTKCKHMEIKRMQYIIKALDNNVDRNLIVFMLKNDFDICEE